MPNIPLDAAAAFVVAALFLTPQLSSGPALANEDADVVCTSYLRDDAPIRFEICKREAEQGRAEAQLQLAYMYDMGKIVERDEKAAIYWFERAIEQGNEWAMASLADLYMFKLQSKAIRENKNPETDEFARIVELWTQSAEKGIQTSMLYLSDWYNGERQPEPVKAYMYYYMYYQTVAREGFADDLGTDELNALQGKLSAAEREEAERRAEELLATFDWL